MYKCIECGAEYKTKPDYCDCGNDKFETVEAKKKDYSILFLVLCIILSVIILSFSSGKETTTKQIPQPKPVEAPKTSEPIVQKPVIDKKIEQKQTTVKTVVKKEVVQKQAVQKQNVQKPVEKKPVVQQKQIIKTTATVNDKKEILNYKIKLRNALFLKLNVANIQGSGKCGIQFAVNSEGKLINRAFTFQSENKTLNDEVYKMLMRLPKYNNPPQSYKGELIKLIIEFNNGEYEISFAE